jgi:hypothetical protein
MIEGRWACLPLGHRYYHMEKDIKANCPTYNGKKIEFQSKHQHAVDMLVAVAAEFTESNITVVTDSWFGNSGTFKPVRKELGNRVHMISRLRSNNNLYCQPVVPIKPGKGRPRTYGDKLGTASAVAFLKKDRAQEYTVNLYGHDRTVSAYDQVVMLKNLKCKVRAVWIYRKTQWVALFSTDLSLSVEEIIEYYGARWKIEACFKELKRDIGSAETQCRNPVAVKNHLNFCMMATSFTWIYACGLGKTPSRRHAVTGRGHFAFSDVRRLVAKATLDENFAILCPTQSKSVINLLAATLMQMAA